MRLRTRLAAAALPIIVWTSGHAAGPPEGPGNESAAILERIRLYREHHGIGGELDSAQMLDRTRWGYARWLEAEHRRGVKGAAAAGWVSLGPTNGAGRMTALAPHPTDPDTMLAGAASGGLWKTTDRGLSWRPLTDGLSDLSVGAVAYAPSDPEVVYIGSGEGGLGSFFVPGVGLIRSPDGGESWFLPPPGEVAAEQFFALSVDPRDSELVLAATERGLLATGDGGASWELRLGHPDLYGVTEVLRSPADPDRLWAALWCFSRCPDGLARVMTSADGGLAWTPADGGLPDALYNNPNLNRTALAVAPSEPSVLYAAFNTAQYTPQGPGVAVYRSADGGATWTVTSDPGTYMVFQGWYDNALTVDPADPDVVVGAGVWYVRTTDGGATWTTLDPIADGDWMGTATLPHVDGHAFAWSDGALWLGCDGGVWLSDDAGATWTARNDGLVTRQYYGLDIDPIRPERVLGGTQDNMTNLRLGPGDGDWEWVLDGDGFETAVNPLVPDLVYGTVYGTRIFRAVDGGFVWQDISPATGSDPNPFATPLTMRQERPWELLTGSSRVWRTTTAGDSWQALGTEVAGGGAWSDDVVRSVAVTPADDRSIMSGKGAAVYSSRDGGASWRASAMASFVNSVALSPLDPELGLAGLARTPDGAPSLLRTTDRGLTWHPAATGLPPFAVQVVRWHPSDPDLAFAGTDVGLYRSTDGGLSWQPVGDGLPAVSVHELRIADDGSRLVVGTHGRGVWQLELADPVGGPPAVELDGPGLAVIGDDVTHTAIAVDPDGDPLELRWLDSDDWRLVDGGAGAGSVASTTTRVFRAAGDYLVAANARDATGRTGFDSMVVTAYEPGDDCATPRVVPADGPFPHVILTENRGTAVGADDPAVPCTTWSGDPNSGRWQSIWLELTPAETDTYTFSTCGSRPDTALSVWTGPACGPYQPVDGACNDDDRLRHCVGRDTDSWLELELDAGVTVRILVGTTGEDETGDLRITVDRPSLHPPPPVPELLIPAAARTSGSQGSFWTSSLHLVNAGPTAATTDVTLLPGPGSSPQFETVELAPGAALELDDVVGRLAGGRGAGALRLSSSSAVAATSRTATGGADGSYGQGIPAVAATSAAFSGEAVRLIGLVDSPEFRTNIGLVNPGTDEISLTLSLYDSEADKLAEADHVLPPGSWLQLNRVFDDVDGDPGALAVVRQRSVDGRFLAYASVVDERTADPTFIGATAVGRVGDPVWVPAAAHTDGVGGARWRTDLTLFNPGTGDLITHLELVGADGVITSDTVHVPKGWTITLPDVVADRLGADGSGALRIDPTLGLVMAASRTYAVTPNGTYGQGIPGMTADAAVAAGEVGLLSGLRQDERFRTNLGFVNTGDGPIDLTVSARAADGTELATLELGLEARSWIQRNQPLPEGVAYAVVSSGTPGAAFLAYASVVDQETADPTYIAAVRSAD